MKKNHNKIRFEDQYMLIWACMLITVIFMYCSTEVINYNISHVSITYILGNLVIYWVILGTFQLLSGRVFLSSFIGMLIAFIYGTANYFVGRFRGTAIIPGDFWSIGTAKNVFQNYQYNFTKSMYQVVFFETLWLIILFYIFGIKKHMKIKGRIVVFFSVISAAGLIGYSDFYSPKIDQWNPNNSISQYGLGMCLVSGFKQMIVKAPEGYSYEKLNILKEDYQTKADNTELFRPNIIAIMNESFSDLSVVSDLLDSNQYMPYFNSLKENTIKGTVLVPTFGGGTSNTEFEFLTGNSMGFIPGTIPYQQYVVKDSFSLAEIFKQRGYSATAIHPYDKSGYSRWRVYPRFGFDEFLDVTAFSDYKLERERYISDVDAYNKVIDVFEENQESGKPSFIFEVTIQNHSDYMTGYYGDASIKIPDFEGKYPDVEEYLTLMKESDNAFSVLIDYFTRVKDPTVILIFGDHQPNINPAFYQEMSTGAEGKSEFALAQRSYIVPFFIWANYDIKEESDVFTSTNFLSNVLFQAAGLPTTPYQKFLDKVRAEIPAMNVNGYLGSDGIWYAYGEDNIYKPLLQTYWELQYNNMFANRKVGEWFTD